MTQEFQLMSGEEKRNQLQDFFRLAPITEYVAPELITAHAEDTIVGKQERGQWERMLDLGTYLTPHDLLKRVIDNESQIKNMEKYAKHLENVQRNNEKKIVALENQVAMLQESERMRNNPWRRNKDIAEMHEAIFGTDSDDSTDIEELDGILSDFVDEKQDAVDLVRSVRGR